MHDSKNDPNNLSRYIMLKKHAKPVKKNREMESRQREDEREEVELEDEGGPRIENNTFDDSSFKGLEFYSVFKDFFN